jgi:isocitrate lyase
MLTSSDFRTIDTLTVVRTQWDSTLVDSLVILRVDSLKTWLKSQLDIENLEVIDK